MNLNIITHGMGRIIDGLENGMIDAPAINRPGFEAMRLRLLKLALLPDINGNTTVDDLLRLDEDEAWQDAALAMIRQTKPEADYGDDLLDLDRAARQMRNAAAWINSIRDRDGSRVA